MTAANGGERCRKHAFPTLAAANRALLDAKIAQVFRAGRTRRREKRVYRCHNCGQYHLTSQDRTTGKDDAA